MANLCQVSNGNGNKSVFTTTFVEHTHDFEWKVENFPKWPRGTTKKTPTFHPELNRDFSAVLQTSSDGWCWLNFVLDDGPSILIEHHVSVTNASGKGPVNALSAFVPTQNHLHQISTNTCTFKFYLNELENFCKVSNSNDLAFHCTMKMVQLETEAVTPKAEEIMDIQPTEKDRNLSKLPTDNVSILIDNLKKMFIKSKDTDVTLYVDGQCLSAHKSILKARSPVFENLLSDTVNELTITDIQMPALKDMLEFLYTGKLNNEDNYESMFQLYQAADKYDVHSLLETCVNILLSKLDISNACHLLSLSDNHHDDNFGGKVMDFILLHYGEIIGTDEWDKFIDSHVHLANKIMKTHSKMVKK